MDYEKAYKYALGKAKEWCNLPDASDLDKKLLGHMFPELKESEDERIRKEIIDVIRHLAYSVPADKFNERIAWLEKHGEKKSAAWSEEDEKQARQIERIVRDDGCTQKLQKQIADWFKSLKDRVQPRQELTRQELTQDDKQYLLVCKNALRKYEASDKWDAGIIIRWLESLAARNTWKPSEEMLEALGKVIPENVTEISEDGKLLIKLYQGLKYGRVLNKNNEGKL